MCESLLSPAQVAAALPHPAGRPTHPNTVRRWIERGVLVRGRRIVLAAERRGGRWLVRADDVDRFRAEGRQAALGDSAVEQAVQAAASGVRVRRAAERARRIRVRQAMARCRAMGVDVGTEAGTDG